jgi:hypothetical protein
MENVQKKLKILPGKWSPQVRQILAQAVGIATLSEIETQAKKCIAKIFEVRSDGLLVAAFAVRVDKTATGSEGVILAGAGDCEGVDIVNTVVPHIERVFVGCESIRYHTKRPGLIRKMMAHGYAPTEMIAVKEIRHGR